MTAGKSENMRMLEPGKPPPTKKARKERNQGKATASTSSTDNMEQDIWKDFPEDLFEAVIARIPIATFFRFRSVCRKWNFLLTSQSFSQQCAQVRQAQPWFYTITHENVNTGAMYDPFLKKWHHPTVPALPTKSIVLQWHQQGLVCFLDIGHRGFYVCNPLTRSFKELPARSVKVWSRVAVGMTLNGNLPALDIKSFGSQAVSVDGMLYFMCSDPDGLVSYDSITGTWKQFVILLLHI
ncbi:UNVERIFIED_CONTAM: F-box only protein 6 [Sesamum latifolium]|uniref:F-box only protein 6 n=1 Tax=Sesamum latifolium TaxID=2727402 RepID=A0AAW2X125_9LAMI